MHLYCLRSFTASLFFSYDLRLSGMLVLDTISEEIPVLLSGLCFSLRPIAKSQHEGRNKSFFLNKTASGIEQTSSTVRQKTRRPYRTLRASLPPKQRQKLSSARSDTALTHKLKCFFYSSSGFQHGVSPKGEKRALHLAFCQGYREGSWVSSSFFSLLLPFLTTWGFNTSYNTFCVSFIKNAEGLGLYPSEGVIMIFHTLLLSSYI